MSHLKFICYFDAQTIDISLCHRQSSNTVGSFGAGRESLISTGYISDSKLGCWIVFLVLSRAARNICQTNKKLLNGSFCLRKIIAIANGIDGLDPFNYVLRLAEDIQQEMCGAQLLSWLPLLHQKYNS